VSIVDPFRSLGKSRNFRLMITAVTLSQVGTALSAVVVPFVAVVNLHATPLQVGVLTSLETLGFLLIGLPVGVWVDRHRRRELMLISDLVRFVASAAIPVAWGFGALSLPLLYTVAFTIGICGVLFDTSYIAQMPDIVGLDMMATGFAAVDVTFKSAKVVGPLLGGALVRIIAAPLAVIVDAVSYVVSAILLRSMRVDEQIDEVTEDQSGLLADIRAGLRYVLGDATLRLLAVVGATTSIVEAAIAAVQPTFLLRELGVSGVGFGAIVAVGTVAAMVAPAITPSVMERSGEWTALALIPIASMPFSLLMLLAGRGFGVIFYAVGLAALFFGGAVYNIAQVKLRNRISVGAFRGRMNGTIRFFIWGSMPLGALIGGLAAEVIGQRQTLAAACVVLTLAYLPLLRLRPVAGSVLEEQA
jgi:Na+/melibiose symporter-like transporter